jgi:hypothetical protein
VTLEEACNEFESFFGAVRNDPIAPLPTIICSGALGLPDKPPPVLCATADLAIDLWHRTAFNFAEENADSESLKGFVLTWIEEPRLMKFRMTLQDEMSAHRVAIARFCVYSVLLISELEPIVEEPRPIEVVAPEI